MVREGAAEDELGGGEDLFGGGGAGDGERGGVERGERGGCGLECAGLSGRMAC